MTKVVGVRFRNVGKIYYFSPKDYEIKTGDHVIACFNFIIFRTEIINLAYITKSHAYYFCHSISP